MDDLCFHRQEEVVCLFLWLVMLLVAVLAVVVFTISYISVTSMWYKQSMILTANEA